MYNNIIQALLAIDTDCGLENEKKNTIDFWHFEPLLIFSTKILKKNVKMIFCNLENGVFQRQIACLRPFRSVY